MEFNQRSKYNHAASDHQKHYIHTSQNIPLRSLRPRQTPEFKGPVPLMNAYYMHINMNHKDYRRTNSYRPYLTPNDVRQPYYNNNHIYPNWSQYRNVRFSSRIPCINNLIPIFPSPPPPPPPKPEDSKGQANRRQIKPNDPYVKNEQRAEVCNNLKIIKTQDIVETGKIPSNYKHQSSNETPRFSDTTRNDQGIKQGQLALGVSDKCGSATNSPPLLGKGLNEACNAQSVINKQQSNVNVGKIKIIGNDNQEVGPIVFKKTLAQRSHNKAVQNGCEAVKKKINNISQTKTSNEINIGHCHLDNNNKEENMTNLGSNSTRTTESSQNLTNPQVAIDKTKIVTIVNNAHSSLNSKNINHSSMYKKDPEKIKIYHANYPQSSDHNRTHKFNEKISYNTCLMATGVEKILEDGNNNLSNQENQRKKNETHDTLKTFKNSDINRISKNKRQSLNTGYSPPILPIPTFEAIFEMMKNSLLSNMTVENDVTTIYKKRKNSDIIDNVSKKINLSHKK
ncbi:unnamed protein product [Leptosia nina]|uniref:Uncharacterized protein n=1 Tax=Leptosia nina TaxID=320188 RepID=A0AAV1J0H0_9NEOP